MKTFAQCLLNYWAVYPTTTPNASTCMSNKHLRLDVSTTEPQPAQTL